MAQVQAVGSSGTGLTTTTVTISSAGAGHWLCIMHCFNSDQITNVYDNKGGSGAPWTQAFAPDGTSRVGCWYKENTAGGEVTITTVFSFGASWIAVVVERDDVPTSSSFDRQAHQLNAATTAWNSGNTSATTNANDIAYGWVGSFNVQTYTPSGGYSSLSGTGLTAGVVNRAGSDTGYFASLALSSTGVQAFTGTASAANDQYTGVVVFKLLSSGVPVAWLKA
jgi:hypothetical protein